MTWANRFRLWGGLLGVAVLVAAFTVVFAQRQAAAVSQSAEILAATYDVGTDYGGTIVAVNAEVGDEVTAGDVVFEIDSARLRRDIADELVDAAQLENVTEEGHYLVLATVDGILASLEVQPGGYAQDGSMLGTLYDADSVSVVAQFSMTRRDFGRVATGASVELLLPDEREVTGTVESVEVLTVQGEAQATVVITSDELQDAAWDGLIIPGAPVQAEVQLRDDGILSGVRDMLTDFLRGIGLG